MGFNYTILHQSIDFVELNIFSFDAPTIELNARPQIR